MVARSALVPGGFPPPLIVGKIFLVALAPRKQADLVLDGVDEIGNDGEDDEQHDDDDCYGDVFLDHCGGRGGGAVR